MNEIWEALGEWFSKDKIGELLRLVFLVLVALPLIFVVSNWLRKIVAGRFSAQEGLVAGKILRYAGVVIIALLVFRELGFSLTPLLGAAGVVGIALAFASQTSVSNIISGLFLIAEKPFKIGDIITIGDITGIVLSIDTLSVKLRTFDNRYVRLPNETLIKTEIVNNTRFPIRRIDINVGVSYSSDIKQVREIFVSLADENPLCLMEPKPLILVTGFGDSSIDFLFGVWVARENFVSLKNSIQEEIKARFDEEGIEIPFPQLTIHRGDAAEVVAAPAESKDSS